MAPSIAAKWSIIAVFMAPALIFLAIGLACSGNRRSLRHVGIVLTSSAAFSAFVVLSMVCLFLDPEMRKSLPTEQLALFGDYLTGGLWIVLMAALGGLCLFEARKDRASN